LAEVPLDGTRADEQFGADLRVAAPVPGQAGDELFLRGEHGPRVLAALAYGLTGRLQLVPGTVGESVHAHHGEHVVRGSQMLPGIGTPAPAPQPFAIEQVRAGELRAQ